jgi:NADPH:quinone reductase-like Zn-dependent oxidoreductase
VRALIVDPSAAVGFAFADVAEPTVGPDQVLIDTSHVSINRGDVNDARSGRVPVGAVLGSDVAGVVVEPAANGTGPPAGTRVVGLTTAAFAERCAVDVRVLAQVPEEVSLADAVALPVAGVAALQALRAAGGGSGRRVLVTGASGGVGWFAVQLAARQGAHVIAAVGSPQRGDGLAEAGAAEVVVGLDDIDRPVEVVLDNVGGNVLIDAWALLAPGGSLQSIGWASGEPAVFAPYSTVGPPKSLTSFLIQGDVGEDLAILVGLLEARDLVVHTGWRGPWADYTQAAEALLARSVRGKAVLDVKPPRPRARPS